MSKEAFNPSVPPEWVSGSSTNDGSVRKFHRAVETLRKENKEVTEESVKELYVKYGGLVLGSEEETVHGVDEEVIPVVKRRSRKTAE